MYPRIGSSVTIDHASSSCQTSSPLQSPTKERERDNYNNNRNQKVKLGLSSSPTTVAAISLQDNSNPISNSISNSNSTSNSNYHRTQPIAPNHNSIPINTIRSSNTMALETSNSNSNSNSKGNTNSNSNRTTATPGYTLPDLQRQVGLLAGKTAKRRLNELRNTSRLPRAHHDFLSDHEQTHYPGDNNSNNDDAESDNNLHRPMRLSWDEIFVEDMLGMGGFGSVCLVTCPKLRKQREKEEKASALYGEDGDDSVMNDASFAMTADDSSFGGSMMLSYASTTTATGNNHHMFSLDPNKYYACKSLSNKTIKQANVRGFVQAASDLVHEAFLLSHINPHSNIVRLYGIPTGSIESAFEGLGSNDLGYFLILEALGGGILSDKVHDWKQKQTNLWREQQILRKRREQQQQQHQQKGKKSLNSFLGSPVEQRKSHTSGRRNSIGTSNSNNTTAHDNSNNTTAHDNDDFMNATANTTGDPSLYQIPSLTERLDIALQIASGMKHLHSHGIVFRDLKPQNVGLSISVAKDAAAAAAASSSSGDNSHDSPQVPPQQPPPTEMTWRIFDFGLAREVPISAFQSSSNSRRTTMNGGSSGFGGGYSKSIHHSAYSTAPKHQNTTYNQYQSVASTTTATDPSVCYGKAGSLRYMAPETMGGRWLRSRKHHNSCCFATFGSDVYSFSILLWELVGLTNFDRKYDNSPEDFESAVCDRGHRPAMDALDKVIEMDNGQQVGGSNNYSESKEYARQCRQKNIRELVHACWREDYRQRPDFDFVVATLMEMIPNNEESWNDELDDLDENTVATDNCLIESELDMGGGATYQQQQQHQQQSFVPQPLTRRSSHSYRSGSGRNRRRLMRKGSYRTLSSRSMLSATSMSNHSMALEDVFEAETEHSNSTGSNRSSQHKNRNHNKDSLDNEDVEDEEELIDLDEDDDDDESMANDYSEANNSLMNESVITISNRTKSAHSRYLEYCADYNDGGYHHHLHQQAVVAEENTGNLSSAAAAAATTANLDGVENNDADEEEGKKKGSGKKGKSSKEPKKERILRRHSSSEFSSLTMATLASNCTSTNSSGVAARTKGTSKKTRRKSRSSHH